MLQMIWELTSNNFYIALFNHFSGKKKKNLKLNSKMEMIILYEY